MHDADPLEPFRCRCARGAWGSERRDDPGPRRARLIPLAVPTAGALARGWGGKIAPSSTGVSGTSPAPVTASSASRWRQKASRSRVSARPRKPLSSGMIAGRAPTSRSIWKAPSAAWPRRSRRISSSTRGGALFTRSPDVSHIAAWVSLLGENPRRRELYGAQIRLGPRNRVRGSPIVLIIPRRGPRAVDVAMIRFFPGQEDAR